MNEIKNSEKKRKKERKVKVNEQIFKEHVFIRFSENFIL